MSILTENFGNAELSDDRSYCKKNEFLFAEYSLFPIYKNRDLSDVRTGRFISV